MYGDHHDLHRRCLESLLDSIPGDNHTEIRIGLNEVCDQTLSWLEQGVRSGDETLFPGTLAAGNKLCGIRAGRYLFYSHGNQNLKKYPMMRHMWHQDRLKTEWVLWLDDDTHFEGNNWVDMLKSHMQAADNHYMGESWWCDWLAGQWDMVRQQPWFKGKDPEVRHTRRGRRPGINFHTGGFVAIRSKLIRKLDWPLNLLHNGGDTLLAEAVRQQGIKLTTLPTKKYGVRVNDGKRRGYSEKPAGSRVDIRR
jgi:hypothetical protein